MSREERTEGRGSWEGREDACLSLRQAHPLAGWLESECHVLFPDAKRSSDQYNSVDYFSK